MPRPCVRCSALLRTLQHCPEALSASLQLQGVLGGSGQGQRRRERLQLPVKAAVGAAQACGDARGTGMCVCVGGGGYNGIGRAVGGRRSPVCGRPWPHSWWQRGGSACSDATPAARCGLPLHPAWQFGTKGCTRGPPPQRPRTPLVAAQLTWLKVGHILWRGLASQLVPFNAGEEGVRPQLSQVRRTCGRSGGSGASCWAHSGVGAGVGPGQRAATHSQPRRWPRCVRPQASPIACSRTACGSQAAVGRGRGSGTHRCAQRAPASAGGQPGRRQAGTPPRAARTAPPLSSGK
jgi:hypothetical protein